MRRLMVGQQVRQHGTGSARIAGRHAVAALVLHALQELGDACEGAVSEHHVCRQPSKMGSSRMSVCQMSSPPPIRSMRNR